MNVSKVLAILAVAALGLQACAPSQTPQAGTTGSSTNPSQAETPKKGGMLKVGIQNLDAPLDPPQGRSGYTQHISNTIYEKLVNLDVKASIIPELATEWKFSPDGKTLTFTLLKGVKFHDGSDFNAAAVKFNIDRMRDPKTSQSAGLFSDITAIEAVDPSTVKITLKDVNVTIMAAFAGAVAYMVAPSAVTKGADGKDVFTPIGSGPFKLDGATTPDRVNVVRFDGYRDAAHIYLDRMEFYKIGDPTVRLSGVQAGDLDIADAPNSQDIAAIKTNQSLGYSERPGVIGYLLRFLIDEEPLKDVNARMALAAAVDRDGINKAAFFGTGAMHADSIFPSHWAADPSFKGVPYDVAKAKEYLAKAGKPNGFTFKATITNREPDLTVAQALKAQFAKIGVDMELIVEDSVKSNDSFRTRTYPARLSGGSRGPEPSNDLNEWESSSPENYFHYKNAKFDDALRIMRTEQDQAKRIAAMKIINQQAFAEDPFGVMIGDTIDFKVWNAKLRGVEAGFSYPFRFNHAWWADTNKPGETK